MGSELERYRKLRLADALSRPYDYAAACNELAFLLRRAYSKLPKNIQSLLFQDTLSAFRLLPEQTNSGVSSANFLIQASEAALPKQRKALAISEFKHAIVAHKRRFKASPDIEGALLPHDVLIHIFNFLDLRSLITAGFVCRSWRSAAGDDMLWKLQYSLFFGKSDDYFEREEQQTEPSKNIKCTAVHRDEEDKKHAVDLSWRHAFERKFIGNSRRKVSSRGYCGSCKSVVWLSSVTRTSSHPCFRTSNSAVEIKSIPPSKVVEYLIGEKLLSSSSSDSDSDSDGMERLPKLWAYPKHVGSSRRQFIR